MKFLGRSFQSVPLIWQLDTEIQRYWSTRVLEYRVVIAMVLLFLPDIVLKVIGPKFVFWF